MNKFLLEITIEFFQNGTYQEETVYADIYADQNFFQVRNSVLEQWEIDNPDKELTDYTVDNHTQFNIWLKKQLGK
jgi:hypothetical protein